jgi:hypothetical protein
MVNLEIYDPALCCSTGVCGPSIDPELLRISTAINVLNKKGVSIKRYNLSQEPQAYVNNKDISDLLISVGVKALPITVVNGEVVKSGIYPSNKELCEWLGINSIELATKKIKKPDSCCNGNTECC